MSTKDVPGANPANKDQLAQGCWAEAKDGSLLFVKSTERDMVVYELYDVQQTPPVRYQDAMRADDFKRAFSYPPTGASDVEWTWHDKSAFPWERVMKIDDKPGPDYADVADHLSAAAKVAESLRLRGQRVAEAHVGHMTEKTMPKTSGILRRLQRALDAFMEE